MTTHWSSGTTIARHLRVKGSGLDPTTTRLRLANLLQTVDMHPDGLAPSAILCVRTLRDPLPGSLQLRDGGYALQPPAEWQRAVASSLNQSARDAARPISSAVPANANAVIFTDYAELLACLTHDWCAGNVVGQWWWQSLFGSFDPTQGIVPLWQVKPAYIPAALQHLAERREALHFVLHLAVGDARSLVQALTDAFALPRLWDVFNTREAASAEERLRTGNIRLGETRTGRDEPISDRGSTGETPADGDEPLPPLVVSEETRAGRDEPQPLRDQGQDTLAPWHIWVPEAIGNGLRMEQQVLLGLGLMLRRAPMHVRSSAFVDTVQRWHSQFLASSSQRPSSVSPLAQTDSISAHAPDALPTTPQESEAAETDTQQDAIWGKTSPAPTDISSKAPDEEAVAVDPAIAAGDQASVQEQYIETSFGGIFYLLNLAIALDLYSDFTRPLTPGLPLNIWDFLALLGLALLGEPFCHDPVWWLLAHLAGRDAQEAPGKDFVPPEAWRIPRAWLSAFPAQDHWSWWAERERLCIYHPTEFIVLDLPLMQADPQKQVAQEMHEYEIHGLPVEIEAAHIAQILVDYSAFPQILPHIDRWLNWLMPYVRARLTRALDLASVDDLPNLLCKHHASIRVTATHLDIFLSLQELPIAIRLSGLDRDPGWIPAAGRFVAFYFR